MSAAIKTLGEACRLTRDDSLLGMRLLNLSQALITKWRVSLADPDRELATTCLAKACATRHGALIRIGAARAWAAWAGERKSWKEMVEAADIGQSLAQEAYDLQIARRHRTSVLGELAKLAGLAALAYAETGANAEAALALERGRALILSERLQRNVRAVEALRTSGHQALVDEFEAAATTLNQLEWAELEDHWDDPIAHRSITTIAAARARLEVAREALVPLAPDAAIREVDLRGLLEAARNAPLAYLAPTPLGAVIVLVSTHGTVRARVVPDATDQSLKQRFEAYLRAYQLAPRTDWAIQVYSMGRWLWDEFMEPVLDLAEGDRSLSLVPCGLLGLLPLGAAWKYDPSSPSGRTYAIDRVSISYSPNARTLPDTSSKAIQAADSLLVVKEPSPVSLPALPHATAEAEVVMREFGSDRITLLPGESATRQAVLAGIENHDVIHLACHGRTDLSDTMSSGLLLANDDWLELRDLLTLPLARARLAVLSACETGFIGRDLPDEVIGLSSGLQQVGVAGIICSLWPVPDISTMALMAKFYTLWRGAGVRPAEALRTAQRWLRDSSNADLRSAFPDTAAFQEPSIPSDARPLWQASKRFESPRYWAGFIFVGQ